MKRTSYEDKAAKGTATLEKNKAAVLYTTHDMPKPQLKLTKAGTKIFKGICEHLIKHNTLCKVDAYYISVAAHQYGIYHAMSEKIDEMEAKNPGTGMFVTYPTGAVQQSPWLNTMNKAFDNFEKACRNLGLQVKARDPLLAFSKKASADEDPDDEFGLKQMARTIKKN